MISHTTIFLQPDWLTTSNLLASWLTAIGTDGAVIVTLWVTYNQQAQRLKLHARIGGTITIMPEGAGDPTSEECFRLTILNNGFRHITVRTVSFKMPSINWTMSLEKLGTRIEHDEEKEYSIPFSQIPNRAWKSFTGPNSKNDLRVWFVQTKTGKKWIVPMSKATLNSIRFALQNLPAQE